MKANGIEDFDSYYERLQKANGEEYATLPEDLKQEVQGHVEEATKQATPAVRNAVQQEANTLYSVMDATREKEQYYTPSPKTWKEFKKGEVDHIHQALNSLGSLVGHSATHAKENLDSRLDEVMDHTATVVHSFRHATSFLHREQARIETESLAMNDDILRIKKNLKDLQNMMAYAQNPRIQKDGEAILTETQKMMTGFGEMYALSQERSKQFRPFRVAEHMEAAQDAVHKARLEMDTYLTTAKAAVATKSEIVIQTMIGKIRKAAKKGHSFMAGLRESVMRGIQKGKASYGVISRMRFAMGMEPRKGVILEAEQMKKLDDFADDLVENLARSGKTPDEIQKMSKDLVKEIQKSLDAAAKKPQIQEMLQENMKGMSR